MKWVSKAFIALGIGFILYSCFQMLQSEQQLSKTLTKSKEMVVKSRMEVDTPAEELMVDDQEGIIGLLTIPILEKELPIVTGTEEEQLKKGVGHYIGSKLPGEDGQIVLSGHRDTVFKGLGNLEVGDEVVVDVSYGTFTYLIDQIYIVEASDRTVIDFSIDDEILLITTCYPFNFIGNAPQRYIIEARPN